MTWGVKFSCRFTLVRMSMSQRQGANSATLPGDMESGHGIQLELVTLSLNCLVIRELCAHQTLHVYTHCIYMHGVVILAVVWLFQLPMTIC